MPLRVDMPNIMTSATQVGRETPPTCQSTLLKRGSQSEKLTLKGNMGKLLVSDRDETEWLQQGLVLDNIKQ